VFIVCQCAPLSARADDVPAELTKRWEFEKAIETPLHEWVAFLARRNGLKIEFDADAFEAEKREVPKNARTALPNMSGLFVDTALRYALDQAQAIYEIHGRTIVIVPNTSAGKPRTYPPFSEVQRKAQKELLDSAATKRIEVQQDLEAPLMDIFELIAHQSPLRILMTPDQKKVIGESRVKVEKGKYTFDEIMKQVLKGLKSTYQVQPDHIRIISNSES
jgi:hypothetical protein